ncbi:hypothetical protein MKW94_012168 [Papaver nudicaule]|uniref:RING-type domain-containing protein n=1 Tax=Papaver nudicaule TaxID=74823 RepID=A0AA41SF32_PAPNU|nr:hypothetical protein [Papaver nudicaule]
MLGSDLFEGSDDQVEQSGMESLFRNSDVLGLSTDFDLLQGIERENTMEDEDKGCFDVESHMQKIVVSDADAEVCSICLQGMMNGGGADDEAVVLKCGHTFHHKCMVEWSKRKPNCPLCRHDMRRQPDLKRKRSNPGDEEELERGNKHRAVKKA